VTLEILDAQGGVVRRYRSDDASEPTAHELKTQLVPPYWVRPSRNPGAGPGMHRFVWDLHETPPVSATHGYPISAVPHDTPRGPQGVRVLPGAYTVRLGVDGTTFTAPLTVLMDPRVKVAEADLRRQFDLLSQLSSLLTDGSRALLQGRSVKEQLDALEKRASGATASAISSLDADVSKLLEAEQGATTPATEASLREVVGKILGLYGSLGQADAAPTAAQASAVAAVSQSLPPLLRRWQSLVAERLPVLNRRLKRAHLPLVDVHAAPSGEEEGLDRDQG
jgi:hypothetical protein